VSWFLLLTKWLLKSRKMRWAGHGAYAWEKRHAYRVFGAEHERKRPPGRLGICGRIILKRT
jgi:hypothetical protein